VFKLQCITLEQNHGSFLGSVPPIPKYIEKNLSRGEVDLTGVTDLLLSYVLSGFLPCTLLYQALLLFKPDQQHSSGACTRPAGQGGPHRLSEECPHLPRLPG
jgi:sulfite exporter TauE/SafE